MLPHNHYYNGQGCAECSLEIRRIKEITKERPLYEKENLEKSNIITHKNNLYYEIIKSR